MVTPKSFGEIAMNARLGVTPRLSLREAARRLNMTASYLSKIELNRCPPPSGDVLRRMASIYNVSVDSLILHAKSRGAEVLGAEIEEDKLLLKLVKMYRTAETENSDPVFQGEVLKADELIQMIAKLMSKLPQEERELFKNKQKTDFTRLASGKRELFASRAAS